MRFPSAAPLDSCTGGELPESLIEFVLPRLRGFFQKYETQASRTRVQALLRLVEELDGMGQVEGPPVERHAHGFERLRPDGGDDER